MRFLNKGVLLSLSLVLCSATYSQAGFVEKFQKKEPVNIVQFGDSHTAGNVFPSYLQIELRKDNPRTNVHYYGKNGSLLFNLPNNRPNWQELVQYHKADLVIFAYGTNEAVNEHFFSISQQKRWLELIAYLKDNDIDVLILSVPEVYQKDGIDGCYVYPNVDKVFVTQRETAKATRSFFWDWQKAMGGLCGFRDWKEKRWARNDGVHLTTRGYKELAKILANDIKTFIARTNQKK